MFSPNRRIFVTTASLNSKMLGHSFVCIGRTMKLVVGKYFNFITSEAERIEAFGNDTTQMSGFSLI